MNIEQFAFYLGACMGYLEDKKVTDYLITQGVSGDVIRNFMLCGGKIANSFYKK